MKNYTYSTNQSAPLQGSVIDLINQNDQFIGRQKQQNLEQEKFQYLKDSREREWREKFLSDNLKSQDFIDVKDADLNNLYASTITKAMDQAGEIAMNLAYGKGTPQDRVKLHLLNQTAEKLKALNSPISDVIQKLNQGLVHDDPELRTYLKSLGEGNIDFDEKGEMELLLPSTNGNVKRIPFSEAMKGVEGFKLTPKVDPFKGFAEFTKEIKPEETMSYEGYETTETKGVPLSVADQLAQDYLYPSNKMSNALKSSLYENGFDPNNLTAAAAEYAIKLKNDLASQLVNSRERVNKEKYDWSAQQGKEKLEETKRSNRANESISRQNANTSSKNAETSRMKALHDIKGESIEGAFGSPDSPSFISASKKFGKLSDSAFMPKKAIDVGTIATGKTGETFTDAKIHGITYTETGDIVIDIEQGSDEKSRMAYKGGKTLEAQVAGKLGVTVDELRKNIKGNSKPKIDY